MNRMAKHSTKWLSLGGVILILVPLLAGCHLGRRAVPVDRSILTDNPCAAPCWQRIVPGETTAAEAWDILTNLEFIDHDHYPYRGKTGEQDVGWITWRTLACDDPAKVGDVYVRDGVVTQISVALDFDLTLQDVLDKYGAPEKLLAYQIGSDILNTNIHFYYPQQGLIFVSWADPVPPSDSFALNPVTPITLVYYFAPTSMDSLFNDLPQYARRLRFGEEYLLDWQLSFRLLRWTIPDTSLGQSKDQSCGQ
jgi:hypothetical protein